jgi:hypothetical protein
MSAVRNLFRTISSRLLSLLPFIITINISLDESWYTRCSTYPSKETNIHLSFFAENVLRGLQESLAVLSPELIPIHERLVNVRRQLVALAAKETAAQALALIPQEPSTPPPEDDTQTPTPRCGDAVDEMESKTPTKEVPNPEPIAVPKLKAELKPLTEELRKIDSLSVMCFFRDLYKEY